MLSLNYTIPSYQTAAQNKALPPTWRTWIAENIMIGQPIHELEEILVREAKLDPATAKNEIDMALRSPYLDGALRLRARLAKRDWLLNIPSQLSKLVDSEIPRKDRLSPEEFLHDHYAANRPVIITGMLENNAARQKWSLDWLAQSFADREVEIQFGRDSDANYEMNNVAHKRMMKFGDYVQLVLTHERTNDFYMTANNNSLNRQALQELWEDVPKLPEYLAPSPGNDGFFWFGPAGTITPFHHDLTNNFMIQIRGRKRIRMIAPWETPKLKNERHCFTPVDGRNIDYQRFPDLVGVPIPECVLEPGEILFLPIGWWHFVEGLDASITIAATNFRWDNEFYSNYPNNTDF